MKHRESRSALLGSIAIVLFCLAPFAWQFVVSFRPDVQSSGLTLANYGSVLRGGMFLRALGNSFLVAGATTAGTLVIGASAAFALARLRFPGHRFMLLATLAISMFPPIATVSPMYVLLRALGLRDRAFALVVPYTTFALPLTIWLLNTFFRQIPDDLYRAARIDGCTPLQAFRRVILPLSGPALASTAILVFISAWNEFLYALTFLSSPAQQTVPVAISLFSSEHSDPLGEIAAASTIASVPLALVTVLFQRHIVAGITAGAVKG